MRSYTTGRNLAGTWTKNTATDNLTYLDGVANDDYKRICALMDWPFLERRRTLSTTAQTQFTTLPYDCDKVREIAVMPLNSTILYPLREAPSREKWDELNRVTFYSNIPEYYYVFGGQVGLWPSPVDTGNTIYVTQKTLPIDLSVADITSTTVSAITNGSTTMTVSGGVNALMAGMYIRVTYTPGSSNTGDGRWYEISGVSGTTVTLVRAYGGTSISAGTAACTISQFPLLPEAFQDMPWLWSAGTYWQKEADKRASSYFDIHGSFPQGGRPATGKIKELISSYSSPTSDMVLDPGYEKEILNQNLTIML